MTKFIRFGLIALVAISMFSNCHKKSESKPNLTNQVSIAKINADLLLINKKYARPSADKTTAMDGATKTIITVGADIVGAATTGKTVCPGLASFGFLGIGAGLLLTAAGGALSSYFAYKNCNDIAPINGGNSGGNPQKECAQLIANVGTYQVPNPYNNPYDATGVQHNQLVKILCQKTQVLPLTKATFNFEASDFTNDQLAQIALDSTCFVYYLGIFVEGSTSFVDANGNYSVMPLMNYGFANDSTVYSIISNLINGMSQAADYPSVMALMNAYENYFISNPTYLNSDQQGAVLNGLSVGKYSLAMWTDAFSADN